MNTEWINTVQIKRDNSVGYIFISGVIEPNNSVYLCERYTAITDIIEALERFEKDPVLETIALVINSVGGSVIGVSNLGNKIKSIQKPVISYVSGNCLSAAYWLASASSKIIATSKNAFFGSIGVLTVAEKKDKFITIANTDSPYKDIDPNTEEGKKLIQKELDEVFNGFVETVAKNRNKSVDYVKENFGQGAALPAVSALSVGLIDEINESEEVLPASLAVLACSREIKHLAQRGNTQGNNALDNNKKKESKSMEDNKDKPLSAEDVKELLTAVVSPLVEKLNRLEEDLKSFKASSETLDDEIDDDMDEQDEDGDPDDELDNELDDDMDKQDKLAKKNARHGRYSKRAFRDMSSRNASSSFRPYDNANNTSQYDDLITKAFAKKGIKINTRG